MRRLAPIACLLAAAACARNPVTHKLELSTISESQEVQMGQEATKQVEQQMGFYKDPALEAYVNKLGQELATKTERPQLPWQFHVVDDSSVNAFALPGGSIFVTRGILATLKNEAELAAVMGHEIGHVTAKHSVHMLSRQQLAQVGLGIGMAVSPALRGLGQVAGAGMQLLFLRFSRDAEGQADSLGFRYMTEDGYDARQMLPLFQALSRVGELSGGGKLPNYLATHPDPEQRQKDTKGRLENAKHDYTGAKLDEQTYLSHVDGIVFGADPRNGFFQGPLFLHPAMRFQLRFPNNWKTQNGAQAVGAVSDKQDAALQLQAAGKGGPEEAATQFFAQKGIEKGQVGQAMVNGQPAVSSYFTAQTEQGPIGGLVTFFRHGDQTFALLGYTSADKLPSYDATFKAATGSFAALNDPNVLNVQPAHMKLVKLDRDLSLEEFARAYPSSAPIGEVALINGLGKGEGLKAGQMAKQILGGPPRAADQKQAAVR